MSDYERNADVSKTLTDKWKKGELPSGWYWVELKEGTFADGKKSIILDYLFEFTNDFERHPYLVEQVLAKVPSYEQWQELNKRLSDTPKLELEVRRENTKQKERIEKDNKWYSDSIHIKVERIEILENILKEVRGKLHYINTPQNRHNIFGNDLMKKLDQVLGEE